MVRVFFKKYYDTKKVISEFRFQRTVKHRTHIDKTAFYICKRCAYMTKFQLSAIQESGGIVWVFFPTDKKSDYEKIRNVQGKQKPS